MIQIDGLARRQVEAAMAAGKMPFLQRLLKRDGYEMHTFYPGIPATTPAVQAELYYGVRSAVPAFSFFDRTLNQVGRMWDPDWAPATLNPPAVVLGMKQLGVDVSAWTGERTPVPGGS